MADYYDPDGKPITMAEWSALFEKRTASDDDSWWRRQTKTPNGEVSTVWLGLDHQFGDGPPLFWESMVFDDEGDDPYQELEMWRYSSRDEAWDGHAALVVERGGER